MIVNERITSYLHSLDQGNGALLDSIEEEAVRGPCSHYQEGNGGSLKDLSGHETPGKYPGGGNSGGVLCPADEPRDA